MTEYTASLRGVSIGKGTPWKWEVAPTGFGAPQVVASRMQRSWSDGVSTLGADSLPSRILTFDLYASVAEGGAIAGQGGSATAETLARELTAAWSPVRSGVIALTVQLGLQQMVLFGRPLACPVDFTDLYTKSRVRARCVFEATDPRMFSATESSIVLGLNPGGGMTFPLTFPLTFGAGSDSDGSAVNVGTFETNWTATIVGPVTTPRITLGATGEFVELDIVVPAGSTLVVSSADGSVLLDGSPRQASVTLLSRFFALPTGTNTIRFRAASGTGSCTFAWRSAWL